MNKIITREQFASTFDKVFGSNVEKLFDEIVKGFMTTNYKCFLYDETVYIIDLHNEELITWYKLGHVGRSLKITKDDATIEYIEDIFREFKNELNLS
jgi:hypothetical protein